jgi:cytochrome c oxidase subunit 3
VATAQAIPASGCTDTTTGRAWSASGTIIWLSSELMFFAALFASYFTIRAVSPDLWATEHREAQRPVRRGQHHDPGAVVADLPDRRVRGRARSGGRSGSLLQVGKWGLREWFILTYVMGPVFIAGQATEYVSLVQEGDHDPGLRVRLDVLPHHRFHDSRDRWSDRLPVRPAVAPTCRRFTHE